MLLEEVLGPDRKAKVSAFALPRLPADEDQASAGARSSRASLLHLWRSSVGGATAFHASEQRTSFERQSRMCRQQMSEHPRLRNA